MLKFVVAVKASGTYSGNARENVDAYGVHMDFKNVLRLKRKHVKKGNYSTLAVISVDFSTGLKNGNRMRNRVQLIKQ